MENRLIKSTCIYGLRDIVLKEFSQAGIEVSESFEECLYCPDIHAASRILNLRSIINAYLVEKGAELNPHYLSKHKSVLGKLIEDTFRISGESFKTFSLSCAGSDSKEVAKIEEYISSTFKLSRAEEADLKIFIGKNNESWEVGASLTPRPLTVRSYKVSHLVGALNPTIAYAMNSLCELSHKKSYLNVFSGSATLLIEAGTSNPELILKGFDNDGKRIAESVKNIKQAGLLKKCELVRGDIFDTPELGMFDVITSDLPFGMQIGKEEDLEKLYKAFVSYAEKHLAPTGKLVVYTTEHELLFGILDESSFRIEKEFPLRVVTSVHSYIYPKIFLCSLK